MQCCCDNLGAFWYPLTTWRSWLMLELYSPLNTCHTFCVLPNRAHSMTPTLLIYWGWETEQTRRSGMKSWLYRFFRVALWKALLAEIRNTSSLDMFKNSSNNYSYNYSLKPLLTLQTLILVSIYLFLSHSSFCVKRPWVLWKTIYKSKLLLSLMLLLLLLLCEKHMSMVELWQE